MAIIIFAPKKEISIDARKIQNIITGLLMARIFSAHEILFTSSDAPNFSFSYSSRTKDLTTRIRRRFSHRVVEVVAF
ncbi:MAG: hypothetical protein ACLRSW_05225 [Christensenellaceae bacterium]